MLREPMVILALALVASACSFSSPGGNGDGAPGLGEPDLGDAPPPGAPPASEEPEDDDADAGMESGDGAPTDDGDDRPGGEPLPPPSQPPSADDGGGDGDGDSGDDDAGDEGDTGEVVECGLDGVQVIWAEDASVTAPMTLIEATQANDAPAVAVSGAPESGEVTFALDLPCAGDYYVWGLVWDFMPGAWASEDADSFYVDVGGPEFVWRYGCQTAEVVGGLSWQPLQRLDDQPCTTTPIVLQAPEAGVYAFTLRNREAGFDSQVAGIGALAIATDPALDPYDAYAPY